MSKSQIGKIKQQLKNPVNMQFDMFEYDLLIIHDILNPQTFQEPYYVLTVNQCFSS